MKELLDQISLRMPVNWITTAEPIRTMDLIAEQAGENRPVYHYDFLNGLLVYNGSENEWKKVVIERHGGAFVVITQEDAFNFFLNESQDAICFIYANENVATNLCDLFYSTIASFRRSFYKDDASSLPVQFVLLSTEDTVIEPLRRMVSRFDHPLPNKEELEGILIHLNENGITNQDSVEHIVKAGLGLSESEFISAALAGVRSNEDSKVESNFIQVRKRETLKNSNILDVRTPSLNLDEVGGLDEAKKLVAAIEWMWNSPEEARKLGLTPLRRLMLVGVPGVGKSMVCEAIATALNVDIGKGGVSSALNKFVGESEANMRRTFSTLRRMAPIVFWIDEFGRDMSGGMSSGSVDGGTTDRVHGEFLTGIQELPDDVFLAAAANRIDALPPEMLRADRFDRIMFTGFPTVDERVEIFKIHLGEDFDNYNLRMLAESTPFFTGAEIKALIKEVRFNIGTTEHRAPTTQEIASYVPHVKGRVWVNHREQVMTMYDRALTEWHWASSGQKSEAQDVLRAGKEPIVSGSYAPSKASSPGMKFGNA